MSIPLELVVHILLQLREDGAVYHDRPSKEPPPCMLPGVPILAYVRQTTTLPDIVYSYHHNPENTCPELKDVR